MKNDTTYEIRLQELCNNFPINEYYETDLYSFNEIKTYLTAYSEHAFFLRTKGEIVKMSNKNNIVEELKAEATEKPKFEVIDEHREGVVKVTKFKGPYGVSFAMTIGYKKDDTWKSKKISILEKEMPNVIRALKKLYEF